MTVSILGCGWFGMALAKELTADGVTVKGSTTTEDKLPKLATEQIEPFLIDLSTGEDIPALFLNTDVLVIAIPPRTRHGEGRQYVSKLAKVLNAVSRYPELNIILVSSTGVYADQRREVTEDTDPQPDTPASMVLYETEQLFRSGHKEQTTILRFAGLIGPGRDPGRFFAGKKDVPNGLAPVNLIHLEDCVGITRAIIEQRLFGMIINAVSPQHPTKEAFYTKAALTSGLHAPQFLKEITDWKVVKSCVVGSILAYQFKQKIWHEGPIDPTGY